MIDAYCALNTEQRSNAPKWFDHGFYMHSNDAFHAGNFIVMWSGFCGKDSCAINRDSVHCAL